MRILLALTRYGDSGKETSKRSPVIGMDTTAFAWAIFTIASEGIVIVRVRHRSDVYR